MMYRDQVAITEGMRVRDLPKDMRCAFEPIQGATPNVAFRDGSFWSQEWREWDVTPRKAMPGDQIVITEGWGVRIVHAEGEAA